MLEEQDFHIPQKEGAKEQELRIEQERQELLARVASSELTTMGHRVAWLMNHHPDTRNSDIALQIRYWKIFEKNIVKGDHVKLDDLYSLPRLNSLVRARARIQNDYKLFQADPVVRERRGTLEESEREKAAKTPDYPVYAVFLDESGKTSNNLIVGSLWFLSSGEESLALHLASSELKRKRNFTREFHFSELKKDEVLIYKELIDIFVSKGGAISFKSISVERSGIKNVQVALDDLYFHLLTKGIDPEISTGRAPLPRILDVWKDLEEVGADKLLMANLETKLQQAAASIYDNKLIVQRCVAIDSKSNIFLQVADLVASSANRVLSREEGTPNHKDELADYVLTRLGIGLTSSLDLAVGDLAVHIRL
ncbi:MAG: hypothetical protein CAF45_002050 [Nitrospira sp. CG24E]|nr:MAG: hypothetical protein CAF45_002050 [Nitrospira sp. CG24E]